LEIAKELDVSLPEVPPAEFSAISWEMARKMDSENLKIESHTVTHPILTNIAQDQLKFELKASKKRLETELDREIENFCYPNGAFDDNVWKSVQTEGYKFAVTTNYGFADVSENKFLLNRMDAQNEISDFVQTVSGFEEIKQKIRGN
jgi:peptidoglycan/xylan/chitin deacetylase (PgdA/CDA1 family)